MPTFLSPYRLGLLLALVSALTATWWGITGAAVVLLALAGAAAQSSSHPRRAGRGTPEEAPVLSVTPVLPGVAQTRAGGTWGISWFRAALRQRHVEHLQRP